MRVVCTLNEILAEKQMSKRQLAREADMDKFYRIALVSAALVAAAGIGALLRLWLG